MAFTRGGDIKRSLNIGMASKIEEEITYIMKENGFDLFNASILAGIEKKLSDKLGLDIRLRVKESLIQDKGYPAEYILIVSCEKIKYLKEFSIVLNGVFPTVRRIVARILSQDVVSVKPMSAPIGRLFF